MISGSVSVIRATAPHRPPGYLDEMLAAGTIDGDTITFDDATHAALTAKYRPTRLEMAKNLARAVANWVAAGFPIVDQKTFDLRAGPGGCQTCPHARPVGEKFGCAICGCGEVKLWLATEQCPAAPPRWLRAPAAASPL